jgi:cobalt-zinc-cadmium efflux system membrane fusion protein
MLKIHTIKYTAVFALVLLLVSCGGKKEPDAREEENLPEDIVELRDDQIQLADIGMGSIEMKALGNTIKANGVVSVEPRFRATVCMPLGGFVKYTSLVPGNTVRKGQVLAVIENQEFVDIQQDYLETRNRLTYAEDEYKRHTELYKDDVYSQKNVQQVTVEYRNLQAKTRSLEEKLRLIGIDAAVLKADNISSTVNLLSPIGGFLKDVNVNIGKYVTQTDVLFEIVNSDNLFLELTLFEKDAGRVEAGQKLSFFISNEPEEHMAVITQTGKSLDDDKSFRAYASVKSICPHLIPGMYVNALIRESDTLVTALPDEAIVSFDDRNYIFAFERNKEEAGKPFTEYRMIEVGKGVSAGGSTQVILPSGFKPDSARIVVRGAYNLLSAKKNAGEMAC